MPALFDDGARHTLSWPVAGLPMVSAEGSGHVLVLTWRIEGVEVRVLIRPDWTPCHYGGRRLWLLCPHCRRRVAELHLSTNRRQLACRHCFRMTYHTRNTDGMQRLHAKRERLNRKLGARGDDARGWDIPPRPKGMWRSTYERLVDEILGTHQAADGLLAAMILDRFGSVPPQPGQPSAP